MPQQNKTDWESRFYIKFMDNHFGGVMPKHRDGGVILAKELKDFIRTLLAEQREEILTKLLSDIEVSV